MVITMKRGLQQLVSHTSEQMPDAVAVRTATHTIRYSELDALANRAARALRELGVSPGDRVGIWLEKSVEGIAVMQAVLRLGAAYVPVDPWSPVIRASKIINDCAMRALVTTEARARGLAESSPPGMRYITTDAVVGEASGALTWKELLEFSPEALPPHPSEDDDLAYILYTSGSTGTPKGVCISHRNALAFIDWVVDALKPTPADRFANHAPFNFDLSVLDLYGAFHVGGSVCIIPEGTAYSATGLVDFVKGERPSIWYSVPSALMLMMDHGALLQVDDLSLRAILFAGEPFPIAHLRQLYERWPGIRFMNLYGPTETNVCTFHEVEGSLEGRTRPVPIGRACSGDRVWAVKQDGSTASVGEEGELVVAGPTVMMGYWGHPPQGNAPYRTGDFVRLEDAGGNYVYLGRRDHMVKVRGHRIELGEIESALLEHPHLREAAVIVHGSAGVTRLVAFVAVGGETPSLIALKQHCASRLPRFMIVDRVRYLEALPRTNNGKVDRTKLRSLLEAEVS
jgi:amino acid adenylation domain-containing protein